jgi:hypothetical protein
VAEAINTEIHHPNLRRLPSGVRGEDEIRVRGDYLRFRKFLNPNQVFRGV